MADRALDLYREMTQGGIKPDPQSYRWLFKCLKQACRFNEVAELSSGEFWGFGCGGLTLALEIVLTLRRGEECHVLVLPSRRPGP